MEKIIRTNSKGRLLYSIEKNSFHVEFGMVRFSLNMEEYLAFERELKTIATEFADAAVSQHIEIPLKSKDFTMQVTQEELLSLVDLFGFKTKKQMSVKLKINYSMN